MRNDFSIFQRNLFAWLGVFLGIFLDHCHQFDPSGDHLFCRFSCSGMMELGELPKGCLSSRQSFGDRVCTALWDDRAQLTDHADGQS